MRILAIETSAEIGSVALWDADGLLETQAFEGERNHAHELAPRVQRLLDRFGGLKTIDGYAISIGPGSFTGLRIGVSFLKGIAAVHDRPAVGISSLRVMAVQAYAETGGAADPADRCLATIDARRGQFFAGLYSADGEPDSALPDGLYDGASLTLSAAIGVGHREGTRADVATWVTDAVGVPQAVTVAQLGLGHLLSDEGQDASRLDPAYLQRSAAEVNLGVMAPDTDRLHLTDAE